MDHLLHDLYPAIVSGAVVGAAAGLYSGLSGGSEWLRGFGFLLLGWALFILSRGLLAVIVLPFALLEVAIGATLPFILAYAFANWIGRGISRRTSATRTDGGG